MAKMKTVLTKEFLQKAVAEGKSSLQIGDEVGCCHKTVLNYIYKYQIRYKGKTKKGRYRVNRIGQKSGKLRIVAIAGVDKWGNTLLECICKCGNEHVISNNQFGKIESCGCTRRPAGHKRLPHWFWQSRLIYNARKRRVPFSVSIFYLGDLLEQQDYKCALSGWPINIPEKYGGQVTASLDRIDSNMGYVPGNVQWVHKDVNKMKREYCQDYFVEVCKAVANKI